MASAVAGFVACVAGRIAGGGSLDVRRAPTLGLRLDLAFDGLGALYALLATGIGAAVFAYGAGYLPLHLRHEGRPQRDARRFWPWMVLFMAAMVGLACVRDSFANCRLRILLHAGGVDSPATRPPTPRIRSHSPHRSAKSTKDANAATLRPDRPPARRSP